jgi:SAM-dependent methyltransferase
VAIRWRPRLVGRRLRTVPLSLLRQHEIAEAGHRILNPFSEAKLDLLGELCRLTPGQRLLDLACGKGELLCRWSQRHGTRGVGVDISDVFLTAAHDRAAELDVADRVRFVHTDAAGYEPEGPGFDVVSCIGATWIGDGLVGTLRLMARAVADDGLLVVGEPYWTEDPPPEAYTSLDFAPDEFTSLAGTMDRCADAGWELVEMVLADGDSWDRYIAAQWRTVSDWLLANPTDPAAPEMRTYLADSRRSHLTYGRRYLGWGVFVLRRVTPVPGA